MLSQIISSIDPVAFTIGDLEVRWYGIILVTAMLIGLFYVLSEARRTKLTSDDIVELFLWLVPLAVIFARILYVVVRPEEYFPWNSWDDFVHAIAIWDGGITIIGACLGGLIGMVCFAYRKRKKAGFGTILDLVVPALLIGQVIGRWGNFVNQEAFGIAITNPKLQCFPFAVYIDNPMVNERPDLLIPGHHWYAATCFYEMAWNLVGLGIAYAIWRKNKKYPGLLGFFYVFWYGLGRGWLEFIRLDAVPITQAVCFAAAPIAVLLGIIYIVWRKSRDSFTLVNNAMEENLLYITELTDYDVKNYIKVRKFYETNNILKGLYKEKSINPMDIEHMDYILINKTKKKDIDYSHIADV